MKLSAEQATEILRLRKQGMSEREIGRAVGCTNSTVHKYIKNYSPDGGRGGEPPRAPGEIVDRMDVDGTIDVTTKDRPATVDELMDLCKLDRKSWVPKYFRGNIWEGFYKLKDGNGHQKVKLFQSRLTCQRVIDEALQEGLEAFIAQYVRPAAPLGLNRTIPNDLAEAFLVVWGIWDAHLGLHAWRGDTGADFDLSIATKRVRNSIDDMVTELSGYRVEKILMPVGNDFMHFDSVRNKTTFGEHELDTDTRYPKVFNACIECLVHQINRALEITNEVEIIYVPGNHDETTSYALCKILEAWFRLEPRVTIDCGAVPRKYRAWGTVLLGFDHGQKVPSDRYPILMMEEAGHLIQGRATWREMQVGHFHQRREKFYESITPVNGVLVRTNPSLCNADRWHFNQGFIGESMKSVEAWRYNKTAYRGSHVTPARD